jgi:uncharacterized protein
MVFMSFFCFGSYAYGDTQHMVDYSGYLYDSEVSEINDYLSAVSEEMEFDIVGVMINEGYDENSLRSFADDFYDYGGYGLDEENSGMAYHIDMYDRYHYISTTGAMKDYMTDERIDAAIDNNSHYLTGGMYAKGALNMIDMVESYYRSGIPEGQYQYDVITGQVLTARHKALTTGEIGLGAIIGIVVGAIFYSSVHSSYKLKGSTYRYDVRSNSLLNMTDTEDTYTHTTTSRVRKPEPPRSSGGGFGGGGGSGVHVGSSGTSHGGGGGRF